MRKREFINLIKKGYNKKKYKYEDAENGESEIYCFKCGSQAGLKNSRVKCINGHKEKLFDYILKLTEAEHDLLTCKFNSNCNISIHSDT
jgi:hypothetical protein